MKVQVVRLTSGEEVIARTQKLEGLGYDLTNPLILLPTDDNKLTFATWLPYLKGDVLFVKKDAVLFTFEPITEMADHYLKSTSKIDLSPSNSIII